jgi:nitrogen fixation protein NifX
MVLERRLKVLNTAGEVNPPRGVVKVAFATSDRRRVDQHFGAAEGFAVYAVEPERAALVEAAQFARLDRDGNEDKLAGRIAALDGCVAVYCEAVGASAIRQLLAQGIQPLKVAPGTAVATLIAHLQKDLHSGPSAWLARAIRGQRPRHQERFDDMEAEGWRE